MWQEILTYIIIAYAVIYTFMKVASFFRKSWHNYGDSCGTCNACGGCETARYKS